ncbi:ATP-dependent DNA helicase RecG [Candidatus Microgenomates bacterium]|nr:ATP-dependent DNA helicase RecG [Candidatus Microgenomates bacterium]
MKLRPEESVSQLNGVGGAVAKKLKKLKIETIEDLLQHYPRRYEDFSSITPIGKLKPGQVTVKGEINRAVTRRTRRGFALTEAVIEDGSGAVKAIWFNQPYLARALPKQIPVYVSGQLEFKYNQYALQNPVVERASAFPKNTARIVPVYPETAGLSSRQIRNLIHQVLPTIRRLPETLPPEIVSRSDLVQDRILSKGLMNRVEALEQIHFPDSLVKLEAAKKRLAFEELFVLILTGLVIKQEIKNEPSPRIAFKTNIAKSFVRNLTFKLTDAQRKAAWQILQDLDKEMPMNRLLEGDVGSGKTVVAGMSAAMAIHNGFQVAMMAPTEVLAKQHRKTIGSMFERLPAASKINVSMLTSSINGKSKEQVLKAIADGKAQLVIGTHALLEDIVNFKNLGLVIIDEQHRFGVDQRNQLKAKAGKLPHLLTMTATPIPRSLALTVYGDLDISIIDKLPPGRKPVKTQVAAEDKRQSIYEHVDQQIGQGRQVYVICPLISESDKLGVKSVEQEAARLKQSVFGHRRIGLLHGRMKSEEKDTIMSDFESGEIDILVSTTVVEVGVDVPNASVMMVEGAERFGLATLHQLRGRVGRASHQSYCYILTTNDYQARRRLELLERYHDGFILAQRDLELRGPGAIYGQRQHGLLDLRLANLTDTKLIAKARKTAQDWLKTQPDLRRYPQLLAKINQLKSVTTLD